MEKLFQLAARRALAFRQRQSDGSPGTRLPPQQIQDLFDGPTPEEGEDALAVIDALADAAEPGLMGSVSKGFFAWVIGGSNEVGVAADWLTSAWGQNAGLFATSPAAAMAEKIAGRWLLDILDLPESCSVGFVTGATMASFTCLAAARDSTCARAGWDLEKSGLRGSPRIGLFLGADAHITVHTALRYLGFGTDDIHRVETDGNGRMSAAALGKALDAHGGPAITIAQAGQINTGAIDPMEEIAEHCARHGAWLHVDGAFGLWARALPEMADQSRGLDLADSWAVDGHKWLQAPYDSGFAIVKDAEAHRRAMRIAASYLPNHKDRYEPAQYTPELSRRARGFAVWAIIRHLGREGIVDIVRGHCRAAATIADRLRQEPGLTVLNDVTLNQVVVTFGESDDLTKSVIERLQRRNKIFVEGASWRGHWVMRISVSGVPLSDADSIGTADEIIAAWREVRTSPQPSATHFGCLSPARSTDLAPAGQS